MQSPALTPAAEIEPAALHRAFAQAFSDYLAGPFNLPFEGWPVFLGRQCVDLARSRVVLREGEVAAFAFVAVRHDTSAWRLATMGALPAARGTGAAQVLLDDFIARARDDGARFVELECFAQNGRALKLYRSRGFAAIHELPGFTMTSPAMMERHAAAPVTLAEAFEWLDEVARRRGDLPLQVTPASLRAQPFELQALRHGAAQSIQAVVAPGKVTVFSLVDDGSPGQRDAQDVIATVLAEHPGSTITVPQLQRADLGGDALQALGFQRLPLHQLMMRRATAA
ncbi:GNAT family N-acetyltransferase [Ramlibacter albus]|uniref:GNAT family N-acetyltransferase n=1 Tax=Ramlibacter albus TaxID=2079448 RepID=A0A923M7T4_9BURK|nr:GNAT family N-acetyltransferase [Ramlibacter albus]MBC5764965.1 GNAT family N-acetyltransferase [Ramlibacter albus]